MILTAIRRYLNTLAAAEFLYDAVAQWDTQGSLVIDNNSLDFFKVLCPEAKIGKYQSSASNSTFSKILSSVTAYADSFVSVVQTYTPVNGSMSEQFNRTTGVPLSARDLTWSYASFITMTRRRSGNYPVSWNTRDLASPPSTCKASSTPGKYAPATGAGAPDVGPLCTVNVHFTVKAVTYFGENVLVTGSIPALGYFDANNAAPLSASAYTANNPIWQADVLLEAGQTFTYQYVREQSCDVYETANRTLTTPPCGSAGISVNDTWQGKVDGCY